MNGAGAGHGFCRLYLKDTRRSLTGEQRERLKGAWSYIYKDRTGGEFHTRDGFYWHGRVHCAYEARTQGILAWLRKNYPVAES